MNQTTKTRKTETPLVHPYLSWLQSQPPLPCFYVPKPLVKPTDLWTLRFLESCGIHFNADGSQA